MTPLPPSPSVNPRGNNDDDYTPSLSQPSAFPPPPLTLGLPVAPPLAPSPEAEVEEVPQASPTLPLLSDIMPRAPRAENVTPDSSALPAPLPAPEEATVEPLPVHEEPAANPFDSLTIEIPESNATGADATPLPSLPSLPEAAPAPAPAPAAILPTTVPTSPDVPPLVGVATEDDDADVDAPPRSVAPTVSPRSSVFTDDDDDDDESSSYDLLSGPALFIESLPEDIQEACYLLLQAIRSDDSSEVIMNGPAEVMMKKEGARYLLPQINFKDVDTYHRVINELILPYTDTLDRVSETSFLVEGQLEMPADPDEDDDLAPMIARVYVITPPVVQSAKVTIAKKSRRSWTVDDLVSRGSLTRSMGEFLKAAALGRLTIVFSGLSGAGKTTMLEALSHYFDQHDRIIVVEDTRELRLPVADTVYMTASSTKPGVPETERVTMEWLVRATNRMRPDRIIVGEVGGREMAEFLTAANSGADGSMTTVHASDPRRTLQKMLRLSMRAEGAKDERSVNRDIASTVQLIVQLGLIDGKHAVTHIEEVSNTIRENSGAIATTPLFEYDRATGKHIPRNRPSDQLEHFLAQRGVRIENEWFRSI